MRCANRDLLHAGTFQNFRDLARPGNIPLDDQPIVGGRCVLLEIANQQLASISKMSLRAFERQFLASFHLTPQKYLRKLRLRIASRALIYTNEPLSELALDCGFADQSHFTREFRRQFGRTPRDYREHYKLSAGAPVTKTAARKQ